MNGSELLPTDLVLAAAAVALVAYLAGGRRRAARYEARHLGGPGRAWRRRAEGGPYRPPFWAPWRFYLAAFLVALALAYLADVDVPVGVELPPAPASSTVPTSTTTTTGVTP